MLCYILFYIFLLILITSCSAAILSRSMTSLNQYFNRHVTLPVSSELQQVLMTIGSVGIKIAEELAAAPINGALGLAASDEANPSGDSQKKLDVVANDLMKTALRATGAVFAMASEEDAEVELVPAVGGSESLFVAFDPLDGSSNIDCASPTGTIFGVYRRDDSQPLLRAARGSMVAAGYVLYSSSTEYVLSCGAVVAGFTLDRASGDFVLTRPRITAPPHGPFYSLNEGRSADWPRGLFQYIDDVKNGRGRQRGVRYSSRYVCSLVADLHRTLLYGGWAGNPRSHLRLLFEAAPLAFILEQAGGAGSDGKEALLDVQPASTHHRLPVFLGSAEDIAELHSYGDIQQLTSIKY